VDDVVCVFWVYVVIDIEVDGLYLGFNLMCLFVLVVVIVDGVE